MKNLKFYSGLTGLILVMMTGTSAVFAGGDVYVRLLDDNSKAAVIYSNPEETMFSLSIENHNETVNYFTDQAKKLNEYKKLFDFSYLEDGVYYFIVKIDGERIVKKFTISDSKVILNEYQESDVADNAPVFRLEGDYLYCYFDNSEMAAIDIKFSSDKNTFFMDEVASGDLTVNKRYDLSQLPGGYYTATFVKNKDSYNFTFLLGE